jgi:hypothetical protein
MAKAGFSNLFRNDFLVESMEKKSALQAKMGGAVEETFLIRRRRGRLRSDGAIPAMAM